MSKGYSQKFVEKVKSKINDVQSGTDRNKNAAGKSSNDSYSNIRKSDRVDVSR